MLTVIRNGVSHRFDSGGVEGVPAGRRIVVIRANDGQRAAPHKAAGQDGPSDDTKV